MSLRRRLVLLAAGTVGVTVVLASLIAYFAMRSELREQIDADLVRQAERGGPGGPDGHGGPGPPHERFRFPPPQRPGQGVANAQLILADGGVRPSPESVAVPVTPEDLEVARGGDSRFSDREVDGDRLRVLTVPLPFGALQLSRSLESVDTTLARLRLVFLLLCAAAVAVAAALTRSYADRLQASRDALAASVAAQRQLVADASHELRTPVTSLRTNVEVLLDEGGATLPEDERRRLLADMREQSEELTLLINDVIELARGDQPLSAVDDVRIDEVVAEAVTRAQRDRPAIRFVTRLEPAVVRGDAERLGRAVSNLLDNAAKHSPDEGDDAGEVEVTVEAGAVTVRDHGPGVPEEEKPLIFDRFYRGSTARGRPGSGLGLAIVRQVAATHGGEVAVEDAPGGGALFRLTLPAERPGA